MELGSPAAEAKTANVSRAVLPQFASRVRFNEHGFKRESRVDLTGKIRLLLSAQRRPSSIAGFIMNALSEYRTASCLHIDFALSRDGYTKDSRAGGQGNGVAHSTT